MLLFCARHARWLLVSGLLVGIALPGFARAAEPLIVPLLGVLLCLAVLREGPRALLPGAGTGRRAVLLTLALQAAPPLVAGALLWALGGLETPLGVALVLVLAASPITGAPGLAVMSGADAGLALRLLTLGTALLPLTAAPVFALLPSFPGPVAVAAGALRLLVVIAAAVALAVLLRRLFPRLRAPHHRTAFDGAMALAMAVIVVALMSALLPAARETPGVLIASLTAALVIYAVQVRIAWSCARRSGLTAEKSRAIAIAGGNRNLALFLAAVPAETTLPLMVFIGCYQIPMYLTPLALPWLTDGRAARA
ncbi:hypothetical protein [Roseivivax sp. THAF30]|uniref:hypothetical protein n=1 Tax=Roseivivax sp. THAF30 TaxID=2587852 RepID=UPI001268EB49|nr:hypothetical protein [Roseivivax sp. THAF30]QFT63888.1 hypothetical protein FIU91_13200 [Roseivivax sp. THAF30]